MNATFVYMNRLSHLKVVVLGLLGAIVVVWVALAGHLAV
jgi:hypothetical protein